MYTPPWHLTRNRQPSLCLIALICLEKKSLKRGRIRYRGFAGEVLADKSNSFILREATSCHTRNLRILCFPEIHLLRIAWINVDHLQLFHHSDKVVQYISTEKSNKFRAKTYCFIGIISCMSSNQHAIKLR